MSVDHKSREFHWENNFFASEQVCIDFEANAAVIGSFLVGLVPFFVEVDILKSQNV
jgi:hypothetical protein